MAEPETSRDPDIFVISSVTFEDKPARNIATIALQKTAEVGEDRYPDAACVILKNTYVVDIVDNVNGHKETVEMTKQLDELLELGGFKVKGWSVSDTSDNEEVKLSNIPRESKKQSEQPAVSGGAIPLNEISQDQSLQLVPQSDTQKVLGSHWNSITDIINLSVHLNFSSKRRTCVLHKFLGDTSDFDQANGLISSKWYILSYGPGYTIYGEG